MAQVFVHYEKVDTDYGAYVVPVDDARPHDVHSEDCRCRPEIERAASVGGDTITVICHRPFGFSGRSPE